MHLIAGRRFAFDLKVDKILLDGRELKNVTEADDERGFVIRFATKEEVEKLVTKPGLVWPADKDVLIQERGKVEIVFREGEP
jgi:hypothetical protein